MKRFLFHSAYTGYCWAHYYYHRDPGFVKKLNELGYEFKLSCEVDDYDDYDYYLFSESASVGMAGYRLRSRIKQRVKNLFAGPRRNLYAELKASGKYERMGIAVFEIPIHMPGNESPKLFSMFPRTFTTNDEFVDNKTVYKFCYPQSSVWPKCESLPFSKKKLLVCILANKYSRDHRELYSNRRKTVEHFSEHCSDDFDLYGSRWDLLHLPNGNVYKGVWKEHRANAYRNYRFAICYENAFIPGNIDEKIFDCMRSNCVPIFLGAPNVNKYIDEAAFINRRDFKDDAELERYIVGMTEGEYEKYREAIRDYLAGSKFERFLSTSFAKTIIEGFET